MASPPPSGAGRRTRLLACIGVVFGVAILAVALAPTQAWAIVLLVPMGAASIAFVATNNATLQLRADPAMRGRVMSLNAIAFLGSTPIGAPLLGYLSDVTNPRVALVVGGVARWWRASRSSCSVARQHRTPGPKELVMGPSTVRRTGDQRGSLCRRRARRPFASAAETPLELAGRRAARAGSAPGARAPGLDRGHHGARTRPPATAADHRPR